jgi:hypothetical protein
MLEMIVDKKNVQMDTDVTFLNVYSIHEMQKNFGYESTHHLAWYFLAWYLLAWYLLAWYLLAWYLLAWYLLVR